MSNPASPQDKQQIAQVIWDRLKEAMTLIFLRETTLVLGATQQYLKANKTQAFCKTKSTILIYLLAVPIRYRLPSVLRMLILSSLATEGRSRLHDSAGFYPKEALLEPITKQTARS